MIYFKVDAGYFTTRTPSNISEFTAVDTNRYYGIVTTYNAEFTEKDRNRSELITDLYNSFGDDMYEIWGVPFANTNTAYYNSVLYGWIPWAFDMYPKLYSLFAESTTPGRMGAYYFKNLNKVVQLHDDGYTGTVYAVNTESGALTNITLNVGRGVNGSGWESFGFGFIRNYSKGMDLSTAQYGCVEGTCRNPIFGKYNWKSRNYNQLFTVLFADNPTPDYVMDDDPYIPGGESGPGGGDGTFDFSSTDIVVPSLPSISASDAGFLTLFNPSSSELRELAGYMWSPTFSIDNFKKLFADPMDAILGLHIIPTANGHPTSTAGTLVIGNISTGLSMPKVNEQYYELDCGEIQIKPKWGAYLDYSPYSQLNLYLPYIGFVHISPDDCMGGSIRVVYHVDVLSGSCIAFVYCRSNRGQDGHVLYSFNGSCICVCPITNGQYGNMFDAITAAAQSAAMFAAPVVAGPAGVAASAAAPGHAVLSIADVVKPNITRSGFAGGSAGLIGIQYPYLVLTVPKMCIPGQQNVYIGYPSFMTVDISSLSGYNEIEVTHLNSMTCTSAESEEIINLLRQGVIF